MPENKPSRLGRYELHDVLGQGAMGIVYKAYDSFLDRTVAVKTYRQDIPLVQQARERFEREVRMASRLTHPNIVVVYDGGLENDVPYLAMELVEGPTLRDELEERGRLPLDEALAIFFDVSDALAYAHRHGVVHRDLKPANILITSEGVAKISDFGVAKILDPANSAKTQTIGTPGYMAPEQIEGKEIGPATDVFALAILAYELLTGTRPFDAPSAITQFYQILKTEPRPPSEIEPTLPKAVDRVIARGLAKNPAERTPDAETFAAELRRAFFAAPGLAPSVVAGRRGRNVGAWIGVTLAIAIIVAAAILRFGSAGRESGPEVVALAEKTPTTAAAAIAVPTQAEAPTPLAEAPTALAEPTEPEAAPAPAVEPVATVVSEAPQPEPTATPLRVPTPEPTRAVPVAKPTEARLRGATIDVASEPPDADVLVDGFVKGKTPLRVPAVDAGNVLLEIRKPGYSPYHKSLSVERGRLYTVRANLEPDPRARGFVNVTSQPPGAKIALEGAAAGIAPVRLGPLAPGRYKIDAEFRGFPTASQTIEMQPGEMHKVNFIFESTRRSP